MICSRLLLTMSPRCCTLQPDHPKATRFAVLYTLQRHVSALLLRSVDPHDQHERAHRVTDPTHTPPSPAWEHISRCNRGPIRFICNDLQAHLTLFPKCFPPFPHGTCMLSYSGMIFSLRRNLPPKFSAPVPGNATLWNTSRTQIDSSALHGSFTRCIPSLSRDRSPTHSADCEPPHHKSLA